MINKFAKSKHTAIRLTGEEVKYLSCTNNASSLIRMCLDYMLCVPSMTQERRIFIELNVQRVKLTYKRKQTEDNALKEKLTSELNAINDELLRIR
jgi:hypothetical protein